MERKGGKIEARRHGRAGGEVDVSKNGEHAVVDSAAARARRKVDTLTSASAALVPAQRPDLVEVWRVAEASCRAIAVQRAVTQRGVRTVAKSIHSARASVRSGMGSILTSRCHARRPKRKQRSPFNLHQKALQGDGFIIKVTSPEVGTQFFLFVHSWIIVEYGCQWDGWVPVTTLRG